MAESEEELKNLLMKVKENSEKAGLKLKIKKKKNLISFHVFISHLYVFFGTPLHYSFLENPMDGGAWWAAVYRVAQSQTRLK